MSDPKFPRDPMTGKYPPYCCQECGELIGYLGRFFEAINFWGHHRCRPPKNKIAQDGYSNPCAEIAIRDTVDHDSSRTVWEQDEPHCPKCDSEMKEFVTVLRCRNLSCRYEYRKIFPPGLNNG